MRKIFFLPGPCKTRRKEGKITWMKNKRRSVRLSSVRGLECAHTVWKDRKKEMSAMSIHGKNKENIDRRRFSFLFFVFFFFCFTPHMYRSNAAQRARAIFFVYCFHPRKKSSPFFCTFKSPCSFLLFIFKKRRAIIRFFLSWNSRIVVAQCMYTFFYLIYLFCHAYARFIEEACFKIEWIPNFPFLSAHEKSCPRFREKRKLKT